MTHISNVVFTVYSCLDTKKLLLYFLVICCYLYSRIFYFKMTEGWMLIQSFFSRASHSEMVTSFDHSISKDTINYFNFTSQKHWNTRSNLLIMPFLLGFFECFHININIWTRLSLCFTVWKDTESAHPGVRRRCPFWRGHSYRLKSRSTLPHTHTHTKPPHTIPNSPVLMGNRTSGGKGQILHGSLATNIKGSITAA